jgi:serine protease Do
MTYRGKATMARLMIIGTVVFLSCMLANGSFLDSTGRPSPIKNKADKTVYEMQNTINQIYELYKDSVVFISTEKTVKMRYRHPFMDDPFFRDFFGKAPNMPDTMKQKGLGTGFIISENGYICTNHHVIADMDTVTVKVKNREYRAKIIGSDPLSDIALLKIDGSGNFQPVYFGDSDRVKVGDMAIAIGNPFGLDRTITSGIISATGRDMVDAMGNAHIQTDASINPGNSGGPLINLDGEVVGVNRMIYSQTGGNLGIGFAIPINKAKEVLLSLKEYGKIRRSYLGVEISPLTEEFAKQLGLPNNDGALVGNVLQGSPAEHAGIRIEDVILKVDNEKVKDHRDLFNIVSRMPLGKTVKLVVWRDRSEKNFWATVKERP